ncbi:beta-N-acetylhexosaminidase [Photobacterium chitinilyticum]|uniref:beta-N-acetylhexosaminidase n=1 Tax=Photobacterium chitinilyticum TaxID=2485123 RepID=A0A444JMB1_9GAMM|nr:beta-N-acetylhexosaminidase [Photobacterium chitinilyticum]RWX54234.1 beta-hexosaminidase [Photobacterium chitinilyticum]
MSYRLDLTVISKSEQQSHFALTLHNLSDQAQENWSLHFTFCRWIQAETLSNGQLKQLGSYCTLTPGNSAPLSPNSHFYTEFTVGTKPFTLYDEGIVEAFLNTSPEGSFIKPIPVKVTTINLDQPATEPLSIPLPKAKSINLIPAPESLIRLPGEFRLNSGTAITPPTDKASGSTRWLQAELGHLLHEDIPIHQAGNISYQLHGDLADGAYCLLVEPDHIWLQAGSESGFVHATASLLQLIPASPAHQVQAAYMIPMVEIQDQPNYQYRGMMLDCARHFHPIRRLKHLIDHLARYKFNTFHWHLTDDEAWRIEIDAYPDLTRIGAWRGPNEVIQPQFTTISQRYGGYYSKQEVRDLIAYANDRGVTIIPEIDIPGHCRAAIKSLPDLLVDPNDESEYRSTQWYSDNILSPALKGTYTFIANVLEEICELFPAPYIHIGCDEVPKGAWTKSPACQQLMEQHGYQDPRELQGHILRFAEEILQARGKRMMGWEEAANGNKISKDTLIYSWQNEEAGLICAREGYDVIMQPAQYTYLDMTQGYSADEPGSDWACKLPLDVVYSYKPLSSLDVNDPVHKKILGIQAALWCELVNSQSRFEYMIYPRLLAIAELCWTKPEKRNWKDFKARLNGQLAYLDKAGINYRRCE